MTTDLEKQFFDTFGIEPDQWYKIGIDKDGNFYEEPIDKRYPQITDRILLELICIYSRIRNLAICVDKVEELKESILELFIEDSEDFKHQVQELFKEER